MTLDPVHRLWATLVYEDTKLSPAVAAALMELAEHVLADPNVEGLEHWSNLHAFARAQVTAARRAAAEAGGDHPESVRGI